jgi:hypothetical protein
LRVLVCGDRRWVDAGFIWRDLSVFPDGTVVIEGEARGADRRAGEAAVDLGFEVLRFPAEWHRYRGGAGPIRNSQQLREGEPEYWLAYHDDLGSSTGTFDMVTKLIEAGIPGRVRSHATADLDPRAPQTVDELLAIVLET